MYFERQIRGVKGYKRDSTDETEAGIGVRVASGEDQPAEDPDGLKALLGVTELKGAADRRADGDAGYDKEQARVGQRLSAGEDKTSRNQEALGLEGWLLN